MELFKLRLFCFLLSLSFASATEAQEVFAFRNGDFQDLNEVDIEDVTQPNCDIPQFPDPYAGKVTDGMLGENWLHSLYKGENLTFYDIIQGKSCESIDISDPLDVALLTYLRTDALTVYAIPDGYLSPYGKYEITLDYRNDVYYFLGTPICPLEDDRFRVMGSRRIPTLENIAASGELEGVRLGEATLDCSLSWNKNHTIELYNPTHESISYIWFAYSSTHDGSQRTGVDNLSSVTVNENCLSPHLRTEEYACLPGNEIKMCYSIDFLTSTHERPIDLQNIGIHWNMPDGTIYEGPGMTEVCHVMSIFGAAEDIFIDIALDDPICVFGTHESNLPLYDYTFYISPQVANSIELDKYCSDPPALDASFEYNATANCIQNRQDLPIGSTPAIVAQEIDIVNTSSGNIEQYKWTVFDGEERISTYYTEDINFPIYKFLAPYEYIPSPFPKPGCDKILLVPDEQIFNTPLKICLDVYSPKGYTDSYCIDDFQFSIGEGEEGGINEEDPSVLRMSSKDQPSITITPNPVKDVLYIHGQNTDLMDYEIMNSNGKLIVNGRLQNNAIDVSLLRPNLYFLKLNGQEQTQVLKFIVQD